MKSLWTDLYRKGHRPRIMDLFEGKSKPAPRPARVAKDWRPLVGWLAGGYLGNEMNERTAELIGTVLRDDYRKADRE